MGADGDRGRPAKAVCSMPVLSTAGTQAAMERTHSLFVEEMEVLLLLLLKDENAAVPSV